MTQESSGSRDSMSTIALTRDTVEDTVIKPGITLDIPFTDALAALAR